MKKSVKKYVSFLVSQEPIYDKEILKSVGHIRPHHFSYSRKKLDDWKSNLKRFKKQLDKKYPEIKSNGFRKGVRTKALNRWLNSNRKPPSSRKEAKQWSTGLIGYFKTQPWDAYEGTERVFDRLHSKFPNASYVGKQINP